MAKPMPDRRNRSRRVREQPAASIDIHHLVHKQQQLGVLLYGRELDSVGGRNGRIEKFTANGQLVAVRRAIEDEAVEGSDFLIVAAGAGDFRPGGERLSLLDDE